MVSGAAARKRAVAKQLEENEGQQLIPPGQMGELFINLRLNPTALADVQGVRRTTAQVIRAGLTGKIPIRAMNGAVFALKQLANIDLEEARLEAAKKMGVPFAGMTVMLAPPVDNDDA